MHYTELKELFHKYLNNTCSEAEMEKVINIFKDKRYQSLVDRFLEERADLPSGEINLTNRHSEKLYASIRKKSQEQIPTFSFPLRIAASFILFILAGTFFLLGDKSESITTDNFVRIANAERLPLKVKLPDGSTVILNTQSEINFPKNFSSTQRLVSLEGEGFFTVTRDEHKPFIVSTRYLSTKVLGTSFNVKGYSNQQPSVTVATGKVEVTANNYSKNILEKGHQILLTKSGPIVNTEININSALLWTENRLSLTGKNIEEITLELERYYDVTFCIEDENLKRCTLRGEIPLDDLANVLDAIAFVFQIKWQQKNNEIILTGGGCN